MEVTIRRALASDWDAIWSLISHDLERSTTLPDRVLERRKSDKRPAFLKALARKQDCFRVAVLNGEVVGVAWAQLFGPYLTNWTVDVYLHDIHVREDLRRRHGIGTALVEHVRGWASRQGAGTVELRSTRGAVKFYRKMGFARGEPTKWKGFPRYWTGADWRPGET